MKLLNTSLLILVWLCLFAAPLLAQNPQQNGPLATATRDTSFDDATPWNLGPVNVRIHYPTGPGTFPVVAFGHGFQIQYTAYDDFCAHLASWGYIVINVNEQNNPFSISHLTFARQMASSLDFMQAEGQRPASRYFGRVDTTTGALGHSMGSGASMLITSEYPSITAVAGMAPAETDPSAIAAMQGSETPVFILAAKGDSVTPVFTVQQPMYNALVGPKTLHIIAEGGHCAFTDASNAICNFGATTTGDAGTLDNATQQGLARRYITAFFNVYLKGQEEYRVYLCGDSALNDSYLSDVQTTEDCAVLISAPEQNVLASNQQLTAVYFLATGQLSVKGNGPVEVLDVTGRILARAEANLQGVAIDVPGNLGPRLLLVRSVVNGLAVRASVR